MTKPSIMFHRAWTFGPGFESLLTTLRCDARYMNTRNDSFFFHDCTCKKKVTIAAAMEKTEVIAPINRYASNRVLTTTIKFSKVPDFKRNSRITAG